MAEAVRTPTRQSQQVLVAPQRRVVVVVPGRVDGPRLDVPGVEEKRPDLPPAGIHPALVGAVPSKGLNPG